ncbi:MAG: CDP-glycerol glycerophosphotransferase family protein [Candidatus Gastranaerophilales bacterium]|nr:CDP-glycerol glycerophosphotransferase family protein [Candidatus Gastranaerophilales bacterium]
MGRIFNIELNNKIKITFLGIKISLKRSGKYRIEHLLCKFISKFCKVDENKILFVNPLSWQYSCNPKYIAEELLQRKIEKLHLIWLTEEHTDTTLIPEKFKLVDYGSLKALRELMTSRIIVSNSHMILPLKKGVIKSKDTIYIQTYHGSMGIKKIHADAEDVDKMEGRLDECKASCSQFDYLLTESKMEAKIFKSSMWGYGDVKLIGKARDSIFYKDPKAYINKIKEYYSIPDENKICLYAPTWRVDKRNYCYNIDIKLLKKCLKKRFGCEWSICIRAHSLMKNIIPALYNSKEVTNVSKYPDTQELLVASDILISDYSSVIPEYTILKKPSFIYAQDYDDYNENYNGFYYSLNTLPSPIATDNYELADNILNFDEKLFKQRAEEFLIKMGHKDDENSCKRIVDFILEKQREK